MSDLFLEASDDCNNAQIIITGIRYDGTSSFRAGSRQGPEHIRAFSRNLETFSPYFLKDIHSVKYTDAGDLDIIPGNSEYAHNEIARHIDKLLGTHAKLITMGGEHSITYPVFETQARNMDKPVFIVMDAHADLRNSYGGTEFSHACVMKRVAGLIGIENMIFLGQRSFTSEEWKEMKGALLYSPKPCELPIQLIGDRDVYLSVDLDVLDPSVMPGTGTPEAGGWSFDELMNMIMELRKCRVTGTDIVEVCPPYDQSGISGAAAAKIVREMILLLGD